MGSKPLYSQVTLYNNKQAIEHETNSKRLPVCNQVGYDSNYHRQFPNFSNRYLVSNHLNSVRSYNSHKQGSPGSQLFYCFKDYANNMYSLHLMEMDLTEDVPKRRREFSTVYNSLSFTQTNVKQTELINIQRANVENAIKNLIRENIKLSLEEYKEKSAEILINIQRLLKLKIKYLPSAAKIMNYVKPNMSKRRFCEKILPTVVTDIEKLLTSLSQNFQSAVATDMETNDYICPTNPSCSNYPLTITVNNVGNRVITFNSTSTALATTSDTTASVSLQNENSEGWTLVERKKVISNDVNMIHKVPDNRKRKSKNDPIMDTIISSDEEIISKKKPILSKGPSHSSKSVIPSEETDIPANTDLDVTPAHVDLDISPKYDHSVVNTQYKSYAPINQKLPTFTNPPDSANKLLLNSNLSTNNELNLILLCTETNINSNSQYSLVSLYNNENISLPKCHLAIQITPDVLKMEGQDIIPTDNKFVFEIVLDENSYSKFHPHLNDFAEWAKRRNAPFIFTIPVVYADDLQQGVFGTLIHEIERPFQVEASTYLTP
jgi:hypothetical protein